jgi:DNA-binding NarL/FixJ family response regulator
MADAPGRHLEDRGRAAHAVGDYEAAVSAYEDACAAYRDEGELIAAARAARTVGWFRGWVFGEWAMHQGWLARARALSEASGDKAGRGWVVLDDALRGSDLDTQRELYDEAVALARHTNDRDLECDATASLGMMLVFSGLVDEGMAHLDAALAAICAGDVEELPVVEGCLCGLLTACERTGDVGRAEEWLRSAERVMRRGNLMAVAGHCRATYAGILVAAGRWSDAEDELTAALDILPMGGFSLRDNALCRLAELRVRQGRYEEADRLLEGLELREDALTPLVRLHLARGRPDLAMELLDRVLAGGPHEDHVLAPLLSQVVEAQVALDDVDGARTTCERLTDLVAHQASPYLHALGAAARAQVCTASGDGDARTCWHKAISMYAEARMPAEVAAARLEVARLVASDRVDVAISEATAAVQVFERVGDRRRDEAAALLRSLGAAGQPGPKRGTDLTRREEEVLDLLGHGLTNVEIGKRLFISAKTAEHHVGRILAKLGLRSRTEAAAHVTRAHAKRGRE